MMIAFAKRLDKVKLDEIEAKIRNEGSSPAPLNSKKQSVSEDPYETIKKLQAEIAALKGKTDW